MGLLWWVQSQGVDADVLEYPMGDIDTLDEVVGLMGLDALDALETELVDVASGTQLGRTVEEPL